MLKKSAVAVAAFLCPTPFKATGDGKLPERLLVCPWGRVETNKGPVVVNDRTLRELAVFQARQKFDRIAFDFQHQTLKGVEPVKVAGYGTPEVVAGEGIYLTAITYTPEGADVLPGGHYPDISPSVYRHEDGTVYGLHSVAACRQGEIDGLTLFSAEIEIEIKTASMDYKAQLIALLAALGGTVSPDATDEQITAAVSALAKGGGAPAAMSAEIADMKKRLDGFEVAETNRQKAALVAAAGSAGKVIPLSAEGIAALPVTELSAMIEKLPGGSVPTGDKQKVKDAVGADKKSPMGFSAEPTPTELEIAKLCGLSADDLKLA